MIDDFESYFIDNFKKLQINDLNWILNPDVFLHPNFFKLLANNLKYFSCPNRIFILFRSLYYAISENNLLTYNDLFSIEIIDAILDLRLNTWNYQDLFSYFKAPQRMMFIKKSILKKVPINFFHYYLTEEEKDFLNLHLKELLSYQTDLFLFRTSMLEQKMNVNEINLYMNDNLDQVVDSILNYRFRCSKLFLEFKSILKPLLEELINHEHILISQLEIDNTGSYSTVVIIGNKVLKVGRERMNEVFPNNPYIVKPLLRKNIKIKDEHMFLEITERVDINIKKYTMEDLFMLYKHLRDLGLVWTDIRWCNVGVLLKDNYLYWNEDLVIDNEVLGFSENRGNEVLKKGDLIVLDADYIFLEEDDNIIYPEITKVLAKKFEEKYQSLRRVL